MIIPVAVASLCSCLLFIRCQSLSCVQVQNQVTLHIPYNTVGGRVLFAWHIVRIIVTHLVHPFYSFSSFILFRYFQRITARFAICKKPPPASAFALRACVCKLRFMPRLSTFKRIKASLKNIYKNLLHN